MNGLAVKAANEVTEFVREEAGEYGHFEDFVIGEVEQEGDVCYIEVNFPKAEKSVNFRVTWDRDVESFKLEINMYEDVYEYTCTYDWHVKYFWIALLWQ